MTKVSPTKTSASFDVVNRGVATPVKAEEGGMSYTFGGETVKLAQPITTIHTIDEDDNGAYIKTKLVFGNTRDKQSAFSRGIEDFPEQKTYIVTPDGQPTPEFSAAVGRVKHTASLPGSQGQAKSVLKVVTDELGMVV